MSLELLHKFMTEELADQLWNALLAEVEVIKKRHPDNRGTSRSQAMYGGDGRIVSTVLVVHLGDGTSTHHLLSARRNGRGAVEIGDEVTTSFGENYWDKQLVEEPERRVVVDGIHYRLGKNGAKPGPYNGYAGRRWVIEFLDERTEPITTYDLWYQGRIPEKYRAALPDNARFLNPDAAKKE